MVRRNTNRIRETGLSSAARGRRVMASRPLVIVEGSQGCVQTFGFMGDNAVTPAGDTMYGFFSFSWVPGF